MITAIIGCMFSSKTTTLLTYERKFHILKKKICIIKHSIDKRYSKSESNIVSHDGNVSNYSDIFTAELLTDLKDYIETYNYDCILIDEAQFFPDLKKFCSYFRLKKQIVFAGLLSDYKLEAFQPITDVLPMCDKIIHLNALCTKCGEDAPFTSRIIKGDSSQTLIGSSESYEPRCGKCHTLPQ
jgi:thymidine kinase